MLTTAAHVRSGNYIRIPGLAPEPVIVEMARRVTVDEMDLVEVTVWPNHTRQAPFAQPANERQFNRGHFYAQFMVTMTLIPSFPIDIVATGL